MSRVVISTQMTLDGVIDPGPWIIPGGEHNRRGFEQLLSAEALLLGRKTYRGLADAWSGVTDDGWADEINRKQKFVASRSLSEPLEWKASLIKGDVAEAVSWMKAQLTGDLLMYGCGEFARFLVTCKLVDEMWFWVHPVVWGAGKRPFHDGEIVPLALVDSASFGSGVTLLRYRSK